MQKNLKKERCALRSVSDLDTANTPRSLRVLEVITSMLTGGAEKLVLDFQEKLSAMGYVVDVAIFNAVDTPFMQELEKRDCHIYKLGHSFYAPTHIVKLVRVMRRYDVVHTHNSSPQLYTAIANLFVGARLITTEHNTTNRKRGHWLLRMLDCWMYSQYEKVVCISRQAELNLKQHIGEKENIQTICNGIDVRAFRHATPTQNPSSRRFVILMVAAFRPQKDQDTLMRAMCLLPPEEYELWLAGSGVRQEDLQRMAVDLGIQERVIFLGDRNDVPNLLHAADVIVMSTHYEGLSLSNVEGMAVGKPFIGTDVNGVHEVTEGAGILVPHEDAEALAVAIQRLKQNPAYYKEVATSCFERAKRYDLTQTIFLYDRILKGAG